MKKPGLLLAAALLHGCTTFHPTLPEGYTGPTASVSDSAAYHDVGKSDFFYLSHIDGKEIENSRIESLSASYGLGNYLELVLLDNSIPARELVLTLVGRTTYAMPARALMGDVYEVKGDITFTPVPNEIYVVHGKLSEYNASVWIERKSDGEILDKIEIPGSSKVGFLNK